MCGPPAVAGAQFGASALGSISSFMGQRQAARATNAAFLQNQTASINAYQQDIEALNLDFMANSEAATQRRTAAVREGASVNSSAQAMASERGLGGISRAAIEQTLALQTGEQVAAIDRNAELDAQRFRLSGAGARDRAEGRINSAPRSRGPSALALGAQLVGAGVSAYTMRGRLQAMQNQGT